jgi:hypothetical protein
MFEKLALASDCLPENSGWSSEVEWSTRWIHVASFTQKRQIFQLIPKIGLGKIKNGKAIAIDLLVKIS